MAVNKLNALIQFTRYITVLALEVVPEVKNFGITVLEKAYESSDMGQYSLVYACTSDRALNRRIKEDANSRGIPANVVDDPELCDFISPAVYKGDKFCIAVSTGGAAPAGAALIRDAVKSALKQGDLDNIVETQQRKRPKNNPCK